MGQILLVRHAQASWGAEDYDVLSEKGQQQSVLLGNAFAAREIVPSQVAHGTLRRQRETAELCAQAAGWDVTPLVDGAWDEIDALGIAAVAPMPLPGESSHRQFQEWFEQGMSRWSSGSHDAEYAESWAAFSARASAALAWATGLEGTTVVFSSGGPIARVVAELLAPDDAAALYHRLNPVCVNTGITRVVAGRRGVTMVSFNEHAHLDGVPGTLTYR